MVPRAPRSTLFPYTTLFRSLARHRRAGAERAPRGAVRGARAARRRVGLSLQGALPRAAALGDPQGGARDRKSTRLNSSHVEISYAVFCLKKKMNRMAIIKAE